VLPIKLTGLEDELQRFLLLIELQVQPIFVQHGLVRYLMELEDKFQGLLSMYDLQV
jgi:hypothetical protein